MHMVYVLHQKEHTKILFFLMHLNNIFCDVLFIEHALDAMRIQI